MLRSSEIDIQTSILFTRRKDDKTGHQSRFPYNPLQYLSL
ncbi:MAG: hypothetical protein RL248_2158 [Pseudomonadota bacterium]